MDLDTEVLIVGGGLSGLAVAWWLAQQGVAAEIWESADAPGGLIGTQQAGGYTMERAASLMLNFRPEVSALLAQSGLNERRLALRADLPRFVLQGGALARVPMRAGALLVAPFWSRAGRLRMLAEPLVPRGGGEHESASAFVTRRLGREALEKIFEPLLASTFGCDPDLAPARAVLPRLTALEDRYGSIALAVCARKLRRESLPASEMFSFEGGMQALVDALAASAGVRLRTRCTALAIAGDSRGWLVEGRSAQGDARVCARHVVLSVPAAEAGALLGGADPELARLVAGIDYAPLAVAHFGFDRTAFGAALDGMGFLAPRDEGRTLLGCQWTSSVFGDRAPPGKVLLSAYLGGARASHIASWGEAEIAAAALRELTPVLRLRGMPELARVVQHRRGLPLYHGAHLQRAQRVRERLTLRPGLHLAANYLDGVSTRDRITSGCAIARAVCSHLRGALGAGGAAGATRSGVATA